MQDSDWPPSTGFLPLLGAHTSPNFTIGNITNYFITRIVSDGKSAKDFKNILRLKLLLCLKIGTYKILTITPLTISHSFKQSASLK